MTPWPTTCSARRLFGWAVCLAAAVWVGAAGLAAAQNDSGGQPLAWEIPLTGAIGPATSRYVTREIEAAASADAPVIILRIDTPGGLSNAMRDIVQAILASPVPVVGYVAPSGARAASAGAYILYATHIAAMAPATNVGAATPITLGGGDSGGSRDTPADPNDDSKPANNGQDTSSAKPDSTANDTAPGDNQSAERRKMVNDAVAYIRSLAEKRGRNAEWAEKAVREAASLSARAALSEHVVEHIADSEQQLLTQIDGARVTTATGPRTLATANLGIERRAPGWRTQLLSIITNPSVAYILFLVGIAGLVFEGLNPGAVLPGVVGAISLICALFAFQLLPVNYAGLALIVLGIALMVAEGFVPSFGALGLSGIAAFVFGSVMLMDRDVPGYALSIGLIIAVAVVALALVALTVTLFLRSRRRRVHTGHEGLIGAPCVALGDFEDTGRVRLYGESWQARSDAPVVRGQSLVVTAAEGLSVRVRAARAAEHDAGDNGVRS